MPNECRPRVTRLTTMLSRDQNNELLQIYYFEIPSDGQPYTAFVKKHFRAERSASGARVQLATLHTCHTISYIIIQFNDAKADRHADHCGRMASTIKCLIKLCFSKCLMSRNG